MNKIGCVQHDCEECQQREKIKARLAGRTPPTIEQMRDELTPHLVEEHTAAEKNPEQPSTIPVAESQALAPTGSSDAGVAPRQDGRGPDAVGVADVDAMAAELKRYDAGFGMPLCGKAAAALTALQEQLTDSKRSEMWLGNDNDSLRIAHEQQAATIAEMREELEWLNAENNFDFDTFQRIKELVERTK